MMDLAAFKRAVGDAMQVQMDGYGTVQEQFSVQSELLCALRVLCDDMEKNLFQSLAYRVNGYV